MRGRIPLGWRVRWVALVVAGVGGSGGGGFGSGIIGACSADKKAAWAAGLNASVYVLSQRLGPNRTTISNYPTDDALKLCTGGMMERGGSIEDTLSWQNKTCGLWNQPCLLDYHAQYADRSIAGFNSSLANFLIGVYKYAYFGVGGGWGGDGPSACASWLREYPEYSKPLGKPLGLPRTTVLHNQTAYSRAFASGTKVFVGQYLAPTGKDPRPGHATNFGRCVFWADGSYTGQPEFCPKPSDSRFW